MRIDWKIVVGFIIVLVLGALRTGQYVRGLRDAVVIEQLRTSEQKAYGEATKARLAAQQEMTDLYKNLTKDLEDQRGQLVAALRIAVAQRDTVIVNTELPTTTFPDSTRIASFRDSTFAGVIDGKVTAPPFPSPLGISYSLTRPAFTPEVGFSKVGDRYVANVRWQGEDITIEDPFFDVSPQQPSRFGVRAAGRYLFNQTIQADVMGLLQLDKEVEVNAGYGADIRHKEPAELRAFVGVSKTFRLF